MAKTNGVNASYDGKYDRWNANIYIDKIRYQRTGKTEQIAIDKLEKYLDELGLVEDEEKVLNSQTSVEDLVREHLIRDRAKDVKGNIITTRTLGKYVDSLAHFSKFFSGRLIGDITVKDINRFFDYERGKYADSTVQDVYTQVKRMYYWAVTRGYVNDDPMTDKDFERIKYDTESDITGYTPEELQRYNDIFTDSKLYYPIFVLFVYTGMRKEELAGLRWKNIDFRNKNIHIENAMTKDIKFTGDMKRSGSKNVLGKTKSKSSNRTIGMPSEVEKVLTEWRSLLRSSENIIDKGSGKGNWLYKAGTGEEDFVFGNTRNAKWSVDGLTDSLESYIFKVTMERERKKNEPLAETFSPHRIRHSVATMMAEDGATTNQIQKQMGHSSLEISQRYINKYSPKINEDNRNLISAGMGARLGKREKNIKKSAYICGKCGYENIID